MPRQVGSHGGGNAYPGDVAVQAALACVGTPYSFGGCTCHVGLDCSCLVRNAWKAAGYSIPRTTFLQYPVMRPVTRANLQPGDCLYYYWNDGGTGPGHVVMYIGGGQVVEAAHSGTKVSTHAVSWSGFVGARRPFGVPASSGSGSGAGTGTFGRQGPQYKPCLPGGLCPPGYKKFASAGSIGAGGRGGLGYGGKRGGGCTCVRSDLSSGNLPNPAGFLAWLSPHGILRAGQVAGGFFLIIVALLLIAADVLRSGLATKAVKALPVGKTISKVRTRSAGKAEAEEADFKAEAASAAGTRSEATRRAADDRAGRVRGSQTAGIGGAKPKAGSRVRAKRS